MAHNVINYNILSFRIVAEPEWVEVITELLLSMLSEQSHLVRVVVNTVFRMLCPHMTTVALQLILDVGDAGRGLGGDTLTFCC